MTGVLPAVFLQRGRHGKTPALIFLQNRIMDFMNTQVTLYGIPNCSTVKKARAWLDANGIGYTFHDFKKAGLDAGLIKTWLEDIPWDTLLNRKGTTWRSLSDVRKASIIDSESAGRLMLELPSIVKRPVLQTSGRPAQAGFSETQYQQIFKN